MTQQSAGPLVLHRVSPPAGAPTETRRGVRRARTSTLAMAAVVVLAAGCGQTGSSATGSKPPAGAPDPTTVTGRPAPGAAELLGVSCIGDACWAVGEGEPTAAGSAAVIDSTTNGGLRWVVDHQPLAAPSELTGISCPGRGRCVAVGNGGAVPGAVVLTTDDGGRRWQQGPPPAGAVDLVAVTCPSRADCLTLATDGTTLWGATSTDGGRTWTRGGDLPPGFAGASNLSCTTLAVCEVAGYLPGAAGHGTGAIVTTADGGSTWTAATVPPGVGVLHDATCPHGSLCHAVGTMSTTVSDVSPADASFLTTDDPASWAAGTAPARMGDAFSISCPAASTCAAVGTVWSPTNPPTPLAAVATTTDAGKSWRSPPIEFVPTGLVAVDCPDTSACVAVGGDIAARLPLPAPR